ncbi:MAG TPA: metallophosphoesterase [Solirubrobacteraceae bacterium]|nr:metallophosphoesterase [Solirubrobacteraceae bacterium]
MSRRRVLTALAAVAIAALVALVAIAPWDGPPPIREPDGPFVASGPADRAVVWAVGDGPDGGRAAKEVAALVRSAKPDRFLYLGDIYGSTVGGLLRGDGSAKDYRTRYAPLYGALSAKTAPTPGNHEWPQRDEGYEPYWRKAIGREVPAYYSFTVAGWQVLSLNSEAPHGAGSPQVRWLEAQLAAAGGRGTCRIAFWHRPRFSTGRHGDQTDVAPLWDAARGRAALVLNGHDHSMQRFRPVGGTTEIVSGAGGHGLYRLRSDPRRAWGDDRSIGALRLDLRPGRARLRFVAAGGRVLDDSIVRCRRDQAQSA